MEFTIGLVPLIALLAVLLSFFSYVAMVSYKLGSLATRVQANEKAIEQMKRGHATRSDIDNIKESLSRLEKAVNKLFERDYENLKS